MALLVKIFETGTSQEFQSCNKLFDESLKKRNAQWGVRDLSKVIYEAKTHGLTHVQSIQMPANNQSIVFVQTRVNVVSDNISIE